MALAKGESNEDSEKDYELFEAKLRGLRSLLLELSRAERKEKLSYLEDEELRFICDEIAMPAEEYEICQDAKEILEGRGGNL